MFTRFDTRPIWCNIELSSAFRKMLFVRPRFWNPRADELQIMAGFTFPQRMIHQEVVQMPFLIRRKRACTPAKGAGVFQGRQNGISNELGSVWDIFHGLKKRRVHLEIYDVLFGPYHGIGPPVLI